MVKKRKAAKKPAKKAPVVCKPCSACKCNPRDWCMWWSGFFATAAVAHLIRWVAGWKMTLGTWNVPLSYSIWIFVIAGVLSFYLTKKGLSK